MAKPDKSKNASQKSLPIEQYEHKDKKRLNNPPVGLVDAHTDNGGLKKKKYTHDPHLEPQLQWAGKAEHTGIEVPTVSLHVHERIDPKRIIETVRKEKEASPQISLFESEKKPLREAIEFYKHKENWSNRLIAGDSLIVMNSLLEKEGMSTKVQTVYFDPPYGIKYGSNFQPFVNKREVKDGKDEDLTSEPEMIKAFRDTWELGIHSYLTYLRDRLLLAKELLHESGSVFVQIGDENEHLVRMILDEVFTTNNYVALITYQKSTPLSTTLIPTTCDYILWYAKDKTKIKYRQLFLNKKPGEFGASRYSNVMMKDGTIKSINEFEGKLDDAKLFTDSDLSAQTESSQNTFPFEFKGKKYYPSQGRHWQTHLEGLKRLAEANRILIQGNRLRYIRYYDDFPVNPLNNIWIDIGGIQSRTDPKVYVVQTSTTTVQRCLLMTTDPGDLVLDITCGSGTTAYVAENWGRRWITCDTSRVAIALAKQRLMTANFDFFELKYPAEGIASGFNYKRVPHKTLKSIANNEPSPMEDLYDQPILDNKKLRVTGPFTVEAVPAPLAKSFEEVEDDAPSEADNSVARSGETLRQSEWRDELFRSGVRAKGGRLIEFTRVEPLSGTKYLQAEGETKDDNPKRIVVCFGPEHAPLEQRLVELALDEARTLKPKVEIVLFCAFHFDPEARKDIEETNWPGITLLEAQMNADLLTDDLKKKRSSNESFWLIGQPDVRLKEIKSESDKKQYVVEVHGFDYYNPTTGSVESGGKGDIAMWLLDSNYDGRSLFPSQVFFPMSSNKDGWTTLAKNLQAEIDEEKIEVFKGTTSLPFSPGRAIAIKIIDARGIESLKIIRL